ncbi:MAG: UDP-glucose 4-epimerase [Candidatus Berkelbacteria bacterium Licking1014_7]|uniref:UDP-glucose 4-epimerase n=1 Tax=Candidatus Berkelbacteria bacterium Licking1014_7 TaxID=2017147 RepID=A0A554LIM3_9BACT|nr:MAG: UDP-glucose 4-epimerase [Candidatus Berkelbacteria bacterium Licking1014_7]
MNIIITGGAGFIGSHVVDRYLKAGHSVAVIDNLSTGSVKNLNPRAKFYKLDLKNHSQLDKIFKREKPEIVNHHAAQAEVRRSVDDPIFDAQTNIIGGLNILHCCVKYKVKKIIYANTGGALYGAAPSAKLPVREDYPIKPESPYGMSKYTFENYLELYSKLFVLKYTSLRYANIYGPRQNPQGEAGVVAIFIGLMLANQSPKIFGDGRQTRDYLFVADVAQANVLALTRARNQKINLGTAQQTSVNQIYKMIAAEIGFTGKPIYSPAIKGEIRRASQNWDLAKKKLGWSPKVDLATGIKKTLKKKHSRPDLDNPFFALVN